MVGPLIRLKLYHSINALFKLYRMQRFHRVMGKSLYVEDTARKSKIANPKSEME